MMITQNQQLFLDYIDDNAGEFIQLQRHLHRHPELSNQEFQTTKLLAQRLTHLGYTVKVRPEGTGIIADLPAATPTDNQSVYAIRADIDALPIGENTSLPYSSEIPGLMHACGHDVHAAVGIASASAFAQFRDQLSAPVRFIFQHSEEVTAHGAFEMIDFGALDNVSAILSLHCDPSRKLGTIGVRVGAFTASYDAFTINVVGKPGHGARPHESIDTIFVMTQIANALYALFGRYFDTRDPSVFSIGKIEAGNAPNAIPGRGILSGTIRTLSSEHRSQIKPLLTRTIEGICSAYGAQADIEIEQGSPSVQNDATCSGWIRSAGQAILGADNVSEIDLPSMGSEDFAHYTEEVAGSMFRLGVIGSGPYTHLHSSDMVADSRSVAIGAKVLTLATLLAMEQR